MTDSISVSSLIDVFSIVRFSVLVIFRYLVITLAIRPVSLSPGENRLLSCPRPGANLVAVFCAFILFHSVIFSPQFSSDFRVIFSVLLSTANIVMH